MPDRLRLHISPLNPTLLNSLLSSAVLDTASNISYHSLQTFPERNYGYIELPRTEAEKMKRKYNGSILKGTKVRIEEAREGKKRANDDSEMSDGHTHKTKRAKALVRKDGMLPGLELPDGRQVQRGWTKPSRRSEDRKHKSHASLYTAKAECLFKTTLPPNVASTRTSETLTSKVKPGKRKRKGSVQTVIVHEFSNTTKQPGFLRDSSAGRETKVVSNFVEGKGWVDGEGNLIEEAKRTKGKVEAAAAGRDSKTPEDTSDRKWQDEASSSNQNINDDTSSSGTSSGSECTDDSDGSPQSTEDHGRAADHAENPKIEKSIFKQNDRVSSSSGESQSEVSEGDTDTESVHNPEKDDGAVNSPNHKPQAGSTVKEVHPLEAIFKRPKQRTTLETPKPSLKVSTSFNFFEPDVEDGRTESLAVPQTPFTKQDFQQRRQRSAAPTPDTAAPGRTFSHVWQTSEDSDSGSDEDLQGDDGQFDTSSGKKDVNAPADGAAADGNPPSDFAKWFWEHRGETNRAWKRRRREAAKEKRHRENKKHGRSVV